MDNVNFKELRARKGWTQADAAKALGLSRQSYWNWENNVENLTIAKIKRAATAFGVDICLTAKRGEQD